MLKEKYINTGLGLGVVILVGGLFFLWQQKNTSSDSAPKTPMAQVGKVENLPEVEETKTVNLKDGDVFEMKAELVKQEVGNRTIERLAYNRQIPGPIIQVQKGATVTLKFTNLLDIPTTLHSHGLRLDNRFDGVPDTMHGAQKEIAPGETFVYTLTFPDAGVYWYHPHIREDYAQEMGLYGNYSVQEEGYWNQVDNEKFLVLDDFSENDPFYSENTNKTLMGRFGNLLLINNQEHYQLEVEQNKITRLFITNTANARPFLLTFPGAKLKLVGGDMGRAEEETWVDNIILAPAERAVVEVVYDKPGTYVIANRNKEMGQILVKETGQAASADFQNLRKNGADYELIRLHMTEWLQKAPDKKLRATIKMIGMQGGMGHMMGGQHNEEKGIETGIEWEDTMETMNAMSNDKNVKWQLVDDSTGKINDDMNADWQFTKGQMVKVEIYNDPDSVHPMQHPIHFHGQRFVVLSRDSVANRTLQWKDTALIRAGERVDLLVEMSNPGMWLAHCHIAEHMHSGMMFGFTVKERGLRESSLKTNRATARTTRYNTKE